jgi:hypothetical protein
MSQLIIIKFGSIGEIAGENMPPPPDNPMGSHWADKMRNGARGMATTAESASLTMNDERVSLLMRRLSVRARNAAITIALRLAFSASEVAPNLRDFAGSRF